MNAKKQHASDGNALPQLLLLCTSQRALRKKVQLWR